MIGRRLFLKGMTAASGVSLVGSCAGQLAADRPILTHVDQAVPLDLTSNRSWLGENFWANRLQDWRLNNGWAECLNAHREQEVRTVSLLSRTLVDKAKPGRIQTRFKLLSSGDGNGFCGFLLGVGQGRLDWRGACFAQRAGGTGGGFMAVMDKRGELSFQDFSNVDQPIPYEKYAVADGQQALLPADLSEREIILDCHMDPIDDSTFDVRLIAKDAETQDEIGFIVRTGVPAEELQGGIMLVSSPEPRKTGTRWAFKDVITGGDKIEVRPDHVLSELMGCMHTINKNVLRLSAQFMPINTMDQPVARLDYKREDSDTWTHGPVEKIGDGFVAFYRLEEWDSANTYDYRIVYPDQGRALYSGQIVKDPTTTRDLKIALFSCVIPCANSIEREDYTPNYENEKIVGRYTPENIFFPHNEIVSNCQKHDADLFIFCGDQFYETYPTTDKVPDSELKLDTLYRWYLWYWSFRDLVRSRPTILLADDHDVLQGNLWGKGGDATGGPKEEDGGFKHDLDTVRMVYRCMHIHNPDPYDPTPIRHDIPVAYSSFVYGGTSFAIVEDRKWKTQPQPDLDPTKASGELLGSRQEAFLKAWKDMDPGMPKVVITASIWGSPQTSPDGDLSPLIDYDSNGYPFDGRRRAVELVTEAKAIVLAGDQHLGMVAHQGLDDYEDGTVFFAGPAIAAFWQRWFEGQGKLENQRDSNPNTGNYVDFCGNKMRILAVANPKLDYKEFFDNKRRWGNFISDRDLKSEGYGLVRVQHASSQFVMECWEWNSDPDTDQQFEGWPYIHPFPTVK